jgi:hypothetical protein
MVDFLNGLGPNQQEMKEAMRDGYLAGVALILSLIFVKPLSLDRDFETDQGLIVSKTKDGKTASGENTMA